MRVARNRPGRTGFRSHGIGPSVVTIGNFDGLHRGHHALIGRCRDLRGAGEPVVVVTFEPLPHAFFRPEQAPARLTTVRQKLALLEDAGTDLVWLMRFDKSLSSLSADEFVRQVLINDLGVRAVVVGEDFRFGRGRQGDIAALKGFGSDLGFSVETVDDVMSDGQRVSSSVIRKALSVGDFELAQTLLGRPFAMEGRVIRGKMLGRDFGYPTANLRIRARPCPLGGIFAVYARIAGGPWMAGVSNLGVRPAVGGGEPLLEVHFFDFSKDIYGQRLEVRFVAKLRDELHFDSLDDLVAQMRRDEQQARQILDQAPVPG
jgi:riboflavin kinase/FMN adenylyltransferase